VKYYVRVEDNECCAIDIYKKEGREWWQLGSWSTGAILFTKCKSRPIGKLVPIEKIVTLNTDSPKTNVNLDYK
jgi:hypothetical protein